MDIERHLHTVAVIVNWNGVELLRQALPAALRQSRPFQQIVVVDNGSQDGSLTYLDGQTKVTTLRLSANRGFAEGANRGIVHALVTLSADCVAILNNDVVLESDWHEQALRVLREHPKLAGCATCLLDAGVPERVDSAGIEWSEDGWANNQLHGTPPPAPSSSPRPVFGVSAAAGVFRRAVFERVGLFDESFFAYQEDVDLALRARARGYAFALAPAARGRHLGHASNRPFPVAGTWADFFNARNRLTVLAKSAPATQWRRSWHRMLGTHIAALARSVPEGRWAAVLAGSASGICRLPLSVRARFRNSTKVVPISLPAP